MGALVWVVGATAPSDQLLLRSVTTLLRAAGWSVTDGPGDASAVMVWTREQLDDGTRGLLEEVAGRQIPVMLLGPSIDVLPELADAAGLVPGSRSPAHPSRVRPAGSPHWVDQVAPTGEPLELTCEVLAIDKTGDATEVWMTTQLGLVAHPVLTWSPDTTVGAMTLHPDPTVHSEVIAWSRLLHLALRRLDEGGDVPEHTVGVGLLGFGAIGAEHASAVEALPAFALTAVCDRSPVRLEAAVAASPGLATVTDPSALLSRTDVDLVIVSTPPDTHAEWAIRVMESGKDVVVEKPFALSVQEADRVLDASRATGRHAVVYQNRRYDPDFLTLQAFLGAGRMGQVFHIETFIGGYGHPCNFWHSDEEVSGGALYDWGSHVIDQILALHPGSIDHVTCIEHKRKWHDVTNADHTSLVIRFQDGTEASFVHSDLAAALKPRWYVLGTEGAITSTWRRESVVRRSAIGTLDEDVLAVTDSPPHLVAMSPTGSQTALRPAVPPAFAFHRELADALRHSWPMTVTPQQSRRVVAVMEAARDSARQRGRPVTVVGES